MALNAQQAFERAGRGQRVIGWKLDRADRAALLGRFPPRYQAVVADHVTLRGHTRPEEPPPSLVTAAVVGHADDGAGVQCLVVAVDGATARPDGSVYHITWSLSAGRRAVQSNDVLRTEGWTTLAEAVPIRLIPAAWPY